MQRWLSRHVYRRPPFTTVARRFIVTFMIVLAVVGAIIAFSDYQRFIAFRSASAEAEQNRLAATADILRGDLDRVVSRIRILTNSVTLQEFVDDPSPAAIAVVERELASVISNAGIYDRAQLIAPSGEVLVRVDYNDGQAAIVQTRQSVDRAYVQRMLRLDPGALHLTPFDQANGAAPRGLYFKPTLRIAATLHNEAGQPRAILALDYLGFFLFERFDTALAGSWGQTVLLNGRGEVLTRIGTSDGADTPRPSSFASRYPDAWKVIHAQNSGAVLTDGGYFMFKTLSVPQRLAMGSDETASPSAIDFSRKLVSRVAPEEYRYTPFAGVRYTSLLYAMLIGIVAGLSWAIAWLRTQNVLDRQALAISEERLALGFQGANDGMIDWDMRTGKCFYSPRWKAMLGYGEHDLSDSRDEWDSRLHPDEREQVHAALKAHMDGLIQQYQMRYRLRHRDGHYIWVNARGRAQRDRGGTPTRLVSVITDVSDQVRAEEDLRQAAAVFESTSEAILVTGVDGRIRAVNRAFTEITGYSPEEAVGQHVRLLSSGRYEPSVLPGFGKQLRDKGRLSGEIWLRRKNGEIFPVWQNVSVVRSEDGAINHYVSVLTDITAIKEAQGRLDYLAHHDPLTGLPNRLRFMANLEQALVRAERHNHCVAILFLDLDRFKLINDSLGHAIGDQLLATVAQRLRKCVREEDTVARLGGDEFVVVLEELTEAQNAKEPAEKIIETIRHPLHVDGHYVTTSTSVGISVFPHDGRDSEQLIKAADIAMYQAKQQGRNTFRYFAPRFMEQAEQRLQIENGLRGALERREFFLCYQPQVSLQSGLIVGAEALLRWRHPEHGVLGPEAFIPVAEDTGLIQPIGEWVMRQACAQAVEWRKAGLALPRLAVNLTVRQLTSKNFLSRVRAIVETQPIAASGLQLDLEITESTLQTAQESIAILRDLKAMGIGLAIDDFGTGYSSLSSLRQLPIDVLKIDRAFIADTPRDAGSNAIASAIVALGHTMQLTVLAEGVETKEQLHFVRAQGCDEAQGFYFSRPLEAADLEVLLRREPCWTLPEVKLAEDAKRARAPIRIVSPRPRRRAEDGAHQPDR